MTPEQFETLMATLNGIWSGVCVLIIAVAFAGTAVVSKLR